MITFNGHPLFDPRYCTVILGPAGSQTIPRSFLGEPGAGTTVLGPIEPTVFVRGTLVAGSLSALNAQLAAVAAQLTDPPTVATFAAGDLEVESLTFTRFDRTEQSGRERGPIRRGKRWLQAFEARFVRITPG